MRSTGTRYALTFATAFIVATTLIACKSTSSKTQPAATPGQTPLEDFFRNPQKTSYEISPDAEFVSYLAPWKDRMNVFIEPRVRAQGIEVAAKRLTDMSDRDVAGYFWKSAETLVYLRDFGGDENFQLFSVNVKTGKTLALTPFPGIRSGIIDVLEQIDDEHMLISLNKRNKEVFDAYRLNIKTGEMTMIAENPGTYLGWMTDHKGRLRVAISSDGVNNTLMVREKESDKFKKLLTTNFRTSVDPIFFTFDNKNIYASSNRGRDKMALVELNIKTGKEKAFFSHPDVDVQSLSFSKKRKVLQTAIYVTAKVERHFFDQKIKDLFTDVRAKLPGLEIGVTGNDDSERYFLIQATSDLTRGAYYSYDFESKTLTKLDDISPWIDPTKMSEMKPIQYKSRDGLTINGYLTLPRGKDATHLPLVINPHGGPWARDYWGFRPEVQFLASRGYAVLQMNFRGSTGYGRKFWEASFKQWGAKMQDDISDGVIWAIEQKIADPKRVAIYGGSYGGYATLAGLAFTPELYAAGVDYVGVSNLFTFMKTIPPYWKPFLTQMQEQVGDPIKDKEMMTKASPVFHVDKIRAPLLVVQGAKDPRVNVEESNQIVDALRKRGVTVEYLVKENEGHGFRNEENRFEFYRAMESFLGKHL